MKKLVILILFVSCGILFAQDGGQTDIKTAKNDFGQMTFKVIVDRENYHPLETIFATFTLSNETDTEFSVFKPVFEIESKLKVSYGGKTEIYSIPSASNNIPMRFPVNFKKGDSYEKTLGLDILRNEMFSSPGVYEIQFILSGSDRSHSLESNKISVAIVEPTGINKGAHEVLLKHSKYVGTFSWAYVETDGDKLLEVFVRDYGASVYGESAIYNLGMLYQSENELGKAEIQFEKIKSSRNKHIAELANESLNDVRRRKAYMEK